MQDKSGEVRIEKNKWAEQKQGVKKQQRKYQYLRVCTNKLE